ncbi:hypothetical protein OH693_00045 [Escherichia coli]|nr:hypothetical protein [Escherichia coli]
MDKTRLIVIKPEETGEGLNFSQVKNLKFAITPNSLEQTEIVRTLNDINAFTLALENLIAKKQAIKAAAMQQLLTGKTRLPQFALRKDGSAKRYKKSKLGRLQKIGQLIILRFILHYRRRRFKTV